MSYDPWKDYATPEQIAEGERLWETGHVLELYQSDDHFVGLVEDGKVYHVDMNARYPDEDDLDDDDDDEDDGGWDDDDDDFDFLDDLDDHLDDEDDEDEDDWDDDWDEDEDGKKDYKALAKHLYDQMDPLERAQLLSDITAVGAAAESLDPNNPLTSLMSKLVPVMNGIASSDDDWDDNGFFSDDDDEDEDDDLDFDFSEDEEDEDDDEDDEDDDDDDDCMLIRRYYCDCGAEGMCPHVAAVLTALDDGFAIEELSEYEMDDVMARSGEDADCSDMLSNMKRSDLRETLALLAKINPSARELIYFRRNKSIRPSQTSRWRLSINRILAAYEEDEESQTERDGNESRFYRVSELRAFLRENFTVLKASGLVRDAWNLVCLAGRMVVSEADDNTLPGNEGNEILRMISSEMASLIPDLSPADKSAAFAQFFRENFSFRLYYFKVVASPEWGKEYTSRSLDFMNELLGHMNEVPYEEELNHTLTAGILAGFVPVMLRAGWTADNLLQTLRENQIDKATLTLFATQTLLIQDAKAFLMISAAVRQYTEVADESVLKSIHCTTVSALLREKKVEEAKAELFSYLETGPSCAAERMHVLNMILQDGEKKAAMERLLKMPALADRQVDILLEFEAYDRVIQMIEESMSLDLLDEHEQELRNWNEKEVFRLYEEILTNLPFSATRPSDYDFCVSYLKKIADMENGRPCAQRIADSWKAAFGKKRLFRDKIQKAGF